jgi:hypothetical protein
MKGLIEKVVFTGERGISLADLELIGKKLCLQNGIDFNKILLVVQPHEYEILLYIQDKKEIDY